MKKKTVQRVYGVQQATRRELCEAETTLILAACEEFQDYYAIKANAEHVNTRFDEVWNELTSTQQNELRPELWGDAAKYIDAPRKRPDMAYERFVEAYERRGFTSDPMGIQIRPNETIGFVYRRWPDWTEPVIDRRESLKRAIEWAGQ